MVIEAVENIWWTRAKKIPSGKVLTKRYFDAYSGLLSWLVPDFKTDTAGGYKLELPKYTSNNSLLSEYYTLSFKLNHKFPFQVLFPDKTDRTITQNDFEVLLNRISLEANNKSTLNNRNSIALRKGKSRPCSNSL